MPIMPNNNTLTISNLKLEYRAVGDIRSHKETIVMLHEGLGCISLWNDFPERLAEAGIQPSVGAVGSSYDNALAETINGLYKAEVIHRRGPWHSFEAVELATLEWVDWFNKKRPLEPIGTIRSLYSLPSTGPCRPWSRIRIALLFLPLTRGEPASGGPRICFSSSGMGAPLPSCPWQVTQRVA